MKPREGFMVAETDPNDFLADACRCLLMFADACRC